MFFNALNVFGRVIRAIRAGRSGQNWGQSRCLPRSSARQNAQLRFLCVISVLAELARIPGFKHFTARRARDYSNKCRSIIRLALFVKALCFLTYVPRPLMR